MEQDNMAQLVIRRIYLKDLSFESPATPGLFQTNSKPSLRVDLRNKNKKVDNSHHEVVLEVTITAKDDKENVLFVIEVEQAGLFDIQGVDDAKLHEILGIFCPNTLFPYLREAVDSVAVKGGLPPLNLAPINFEQMFHEANARMAKEQQAKAESSEAQDDVDEEGKPRLYPVK